MRLSPNPLSRLHAKSPLVATLVVLNLVVGCGWLVYWGVQERERRREGIRHHENSIKISVAMGGLDSNEARNLQRIVGRTMVDKTISDVDADALLTLLRNPTGESAASPMFRSIKILGVFRVATNLPPERRRRIDEGLLAFLKKEPVGKYEAPAKWATMILIRHGDPGMRTALANLAKSSPPVRRSMIEGLLTGTTKLEF